jgi:hypothetical protein
LTITLAGHTADWRFRDSAALDAWLASAPWQNRSEVRVVRVSSPELAPVFMAALTRAVRGHDAGRSGVAFHEVGVGQLAAGLPAALAELLEVPGGLNRFEMMRQTARALAGRPGVILVPPTGEPGTGQLAQATDWLDRLRRADPAVQVAMLLLDTPRERLAGKVFDLSVGLPVDRLLSGGGSAGVLWRGYLHHRLAWESAGDLERANAAVVVRALAVGADAEFEKLLNESARAAYEAVPGARRQAVRQYLEERVRGTRPRGWLAGRAADLEQDRLLWRPSGVGGQATAAPWLARALLLAQVVPVCEFLLRDGLVCAPLAHELLGGCFDLEGQERAVLFARRVNQAPPDRAIERWRAFGEPCAMQAGLYPPGCPARPEDAWPFATFGEFLSVMAPDDPRRDAWYDLLNLRNHVAHGHYVGWAAVQKLREVEERLLA